MHQLICVTYTKMLALYYYREFDTDDKSYKRFWVTLIFYCIRRILLKRYTAGFVLFFFNFVKKYKYCRRLNRKRRQFYRQCFCNFRIRFELGSRRLLLQIVKRIE